MTKLEAVYTWLKTYPGFKNLDFNFGISKNNNSVLIPAPNDYVVYEDITGRKIRHLTFSVSNYKHLSNLPNTKDNLDNMEEVQKFLDWIDTQDNAKNYPIFPDNCKIEYIKNLKNLPTTTAINNNLARFYNQIQIRYIEQ